ncbi:Hypothetical Protein FCC1311_059882 [Hondaea fermentalgiana]|uniref:Uncharacterized protein n=1 Tax=Hondaea fermentalgiana TaxID=2315210 RepID=A0A2R5GFW7_9STRA|nr:Hypothetical Protein FCC1311_059882 [Hondaea fermentalgiana]|eukprot:GBG29767.1 Hypothetical Protein FCC1311_059882 [Hondaea fermentalgiana]
MAAPPPVADIGASTASSSSSTSNAAQHGRASHPSSSSSSSSSSLTSKADISAAASANPTAAHVEGISGSKAITSGTGPYRIASTASLGSLGSAQSPLSATPTAGGGASPHHVSLTGPWPPGIGSTAGQGQGDSPTLAAENRQLHCSPVEALAEAFVDLFHRQEIKTVAATRFVKLCLYLFRAKPTEQLRNFVERAAGVLDANLIDIYNEQSEALNRSAKARQDAASASPTAATAASASPDVLDASARAEALSRRFGFREKWAVEGAAFAELSVAEGILTARCNPLWNRLFPNNDVLARLGLLDAIALPFPERDGIALFHEISDIVLTKTDDVTVSRKVLSMYLGGTPHKLSALVDMHFAMSDDGSVAQCTLRALPLPDSPAFGMQQGCIFKSQYYLQMVPAMATGPPHGPYPPPHAQGHSGDNSSSGSHTTGQHSQSHHQQHHLQQQAHGRPAHAGSHADLASLQPQAHSAAGPSSPSSLYIMDFLGSIKSDADVKTASDAAAARGSSSATAAASSSSSSSSSIVPKHSHSAMEIDNSALASQQHQGEARPQTQAQALGKRQPHAALESSGDLPDRARHHGKLSSV